MFIELVDALRCVVPHEDTWLVAAVSEFRGRHMARGSLGCPVCRRQYVVENGEVVMDGARVPTTPAGPPDAEALVRARALLHLAEPGGVVALAGSAAPLAQVLEEEVQVAFVLLNPVGALLEPGVSTMWVGDRVPFAPGSLRAAMIGDGAWSAAFVASVAAAVKPGGRLVGPAATPLPPDVVELARDAHQWVAERTRERLSAPVSLRRA